MHTSSGIGMRPRRSPLGVITYTPAGTSAVSPACLGKKDSGRDPEIAVLVEPHAVAASAAAEVEDQALAA